MTNVSNKRQKYEKKCTVSIASTVGLLHANTQFSWHDNIHVVLYGVNHIRFSILGLVAVPGAAGGQFIGGIICKKWKLKVKGMLRLNVIVCILALLLDAVVWIRCDLEDIAGVNVGYGQG